MMSSEEETDCFGLYGDKLLKKAKRARQRVDAGEPRNSYSSIPNFTSRPSFMSGGLYGAIFNQNPQHFGLFGPGYGPAKMLNELLGRQAKALEASPQELPGETAAERQSSAAALANPDLAHHMLRDILQGRKKELMQLEREMRGSAVSPDNNNSINNNNNELKNGASLDSNDNSGDDVSKRVNGIEVVDSNSGDEATAAAAAMRDCLQEAGIGGTQQQAELLDEAMSGVNGGGSDSARSLPSPSMDSLVTPKVELDADQQPDKDDPPSPTVIKSEQMPLDMKRARVENIVSTMRSSPVAVQPQVNGCKKRKLYQPQQHDNSAAERYATVGLGLGLNLQKLMLDDDDDDDGDQNPPIHQKLVEKNALKSQLRSMQEQLAEMQQKYAQLCNRMEQESETQDNEELNSDLEQDGSEHAPKLSPRSPASPPAKEQAPTPVLPATSTPKMLSQMMNKVMTDKMYLGHPHGIPTNFNGAIPLMQHVQHTPNHEPPMPHSMQHQHPGAQHPHHAISNAAAMYLGQKLFMEQEVRHAMAKEAAAAAAHAAEQHQQAAQHHHQQQQQQQQQQQMQQQHHEQHRQQGQHSPTQSHQSSSKTPSISNELTERLSIMRNSANSIGPVSGADLEGLADVLKTEISASLSNLIDSIVTRFVHQRRYMGKQSEAAAAAAEQLNKDLMMASQLLEQKSPRLKSADRPPTNPLTGNAPNHSNVSSNTNLTMTNSMINHPSSMNNVLNPSMQMNGPRMNGSAFPPMSVPLDMSGVGSEAAISQMSQMSHMRPSPSAAMFQAPKPPQGAMMSGGLYGGMNHLNNSFGMDREQNSEQNEALSLVVIPKKKRHKVTDTRITPRTVSRILAQDGPGPSPGCPGPAESPSPRPYHPAPPMLPVSLPTSVAIPNPSLHESQVFSPYSPFFGPHGPLHAGVAGNTRMRPPMPPSPLSLGLLEARDSPPLPHAPALLHPALLAAARHAEDYSHPALRGVDVPDPHSDCNSTDLTYDGIQPTSSTLTPMHLRKAKLMFFWVRYPSSAVLKMYFPDIKFNKNNTAQLVKWFSNFREFYYIQMEKYARQAVSEGVKSAEELHVAGDSEIYRVLNLHYNRNNHIEVPSNFRYVVEQTLREFFRAIQGGKDTEQSWKKSIYKVISRLDDPVPEYFKSPNFLEQLE